MIARADGGRSALRALALYLVCAPSPAELRDYVLDRARPLADGFGVPESRFVRTVAATPDEQLSGLMRGSLAFASAAAALMVRREDPYRAAARIALDWHTEQASPRDARKLKLYQAIHARLACEAYPSLCVRGHGHDGDHASADGQRWSALGSVA